MGAAGTTTQRPVPSSPAATHATCQLDDSLPEIKGGTAKAAATAAAATAEMSPAAGAVAAAPVKPLFRGLSHQYACFMALSAGAVMVASAPTSKGMLAAAIFIVSLVALFGTSALYHRGKWAPATHRWMHRADHAAIFMLIAGTYTPVCMLALTNHTAHPLLGLVWGVAGLGIMQTFFWSSAPRLLVVALYLFMGWICLPFMHDFTDGLGPFGVFWVAAGGACYTVGALVYAMHWPNPSPVFFGYHEIFHVFTIVASVCHFVAVYTLVHATALVKV